MRSGPSQIQHGFGLSDCAMATFAQLRAFHLVASTGGFSQAAREASTSQSALSGHVRALEAESGRALFERQARRVVPTMDGQDLYAVTTRLFSALTEASALLNSPAVEGGRLRVVADGAAHSLPILRALTTKRPKLHFTLDVRNSDQVLQQIKEHRADVGVTAQRPDDPNLHAVPLTTMKLGLMVPADSVWAGRRQAVLADLSGQPFVLREKGSRTRHVFERNLARAKVTLGPVLDVSSREGIREAVALGFGLGAIADQEFGFDSRLSFIPLLDAEIAIEEYVVCLSERRRLPLIVDFMAAAATVFASR